MTGLLASLDILFHGRVIADVMAITDVMRSPDAEVRSNPPLWTWERRPDSFRPIVRDAATLASGNLQSSRSEGSTGQQVRVKVNRIGESSIR